jgi:hypothetical protein
LVCRLQFLCGLREEKGAPVGVSAHDALLRQDDCACCFGDSAARQPSVYMCSMAGVISYSFTSERRPGRTCSRTVSPVRTRANSRHDIPLRSFHTASLPGCECVFQRYALTDGCRCTTLRRENVQFSGKVRDTQTHPTAGRSWRCIISQSSEVRNTCQLSLPPPTATYPKWPLDLVLRALRAN